MEKDMTVQVEPSKDVDRIAYIQPQSLLVKDVQDTMTDQLSSSADTENYEMF